MHCMYLGHVLLGAPARCPALPPLPIYLHHFMHTYLHVLYTLVE